MTPKEEWWQRFLQRGREHQNKVVGKTAALKSELERQQASREVVPSHMPVAVGAIPIEQADLRETVRKRQDEMRQEVSKTTLYERQAKLIDKRQRLAREGETKPKIVVKTQQPDHQKLGYRVSQSLDLSTMRHTVTEYDSVETVVGALKQRRQEQAAKKKRPQPSNDPALDIHTRQVIWHKEKQARAAQSRQLAAQSLDRERADVWAKVRKSTNKVLSSSMNDLLSASTAKPSSRTPAAPTPTSPPPALDVAASAEGFAVGLDGLGTTALATTTPRSEAPALSPSPRPTPAQLRTRDLEHARKLEQRWETLETKKIEKQLVACGFDREDVAAMVARQWKAELARISRGTDKVTRKQRLLGLERMAGVAFEHLHRAKVKADHAQTQPFLTQKKTKPVEGKFESKLQQSKSVSRRRKALESKGEQEAAAKKKAAKLKAMMAKRRQLLAANHKRVTGDERNPFAFRDLIKGVGSGHVELDEFEEETDAGAHADSQAQAEAKAAKVWDKLAKHIKAQHLTAATLFSELDRDRSGSVSQAEFVNKVKDITGIDLGADPPALRAVMAEVDGNNDHEIGYNEFLARVKLSMPKPPKPVFDELGEDAAAEETKDATSADPATATTGDPPADDTAAADPPPAGAPSDDPPADDTATADPQPVDAATSELPPVSAPGQAEASEVDAT